MLELYHWEPNADSGRPLLYLNEKGASFTSRYVDVLRFEQHAADILTLNPKGQVPVLVHERQAYTEASYIEQYLEEIFPGPALMPADAFGRWRVRAWQKHIDEEIAPFIAQLDAPALRDKLLSLHGDERMRAALQRVPTKERRDVWFAAALEGHSDEQLREARRKIATSIREEIEPALSRNVWLAGDDYTLADGAAFCFVSFLPRLAPEIVNPTSTPRIVQWLDRMRARPAVQATLAMARSRDPFAVAAPGPEPIRWG